MSCGTASVYFERRHDFYPDFDPYFYRDLHVTNGYFACAPAKFRLSGRIMYSVAYPCCPNTTGTDSLRTLHLIDEHVT